MKAKYINPFTDYGFKKLFGEEASKPALIDFLNALLIEYGNVQVADITFRNNEQLGSSNTDRKAVYDIYCENEKGEKFIVELQKARQDFFKERTIFYSTFPIREQAEQGDWKYNLKAIYCIGILDFVFKDYQTPNDHKQVVHHVTLKDQFCKTFYNKLSYIYVEMPNFDKQENELVSRLDKWLYFIKHLEDFQYIPEIFKHEVVFVNALDKANIDNFNTPQLDAYEASLKHFRDIKNVVDTAFDEGTQKGKKEGFKEGFGEGILNEKLEIAKAMKQEGIPQNTIVKITGLTLLEIDAL